MDWVPKHDWQKIRVGSIVKIAKSSYDFPNEKAIVTSRQAPLAVTVMTFSGHWAYIRGFEYKELILISE